MGCFRGLYHEHLPKYEYINLFLSKLKAKMFCILICRNFGSHKSNILKHGYCALIKCYLKTISLIYNRILHIYLFFCTSFDKSLVINIRALIRSNRSHTSFVRNTVPLYFKNKLFAPDSCL